MSVWDRVQDVLERFDAQIEVGCASGTGWDGELRLTLTNPEGEPSRSITFYSTGGYDPEEVAEALLADVDAYLAEGGQEPLPVAEWMRDGAER